MRGALVDVSPAVFTLLDAAGHASPVARMSLCTITVMRDTLREAIGVVAGYAQRKDLMRGGAAQFLLQCGIPTEPVQIMLRNFVDQIDDIIYRSIGERAWHRFYYIEMGNGVNLYHLTITKLEDYEQDADDRY